MARPESSIERENAEFAALALESLQEAVRRALVDHGQRGHLVPAWRAVKVEWVAPGEILSQYSAHGQSGAAADAEQGAAADGQPASRIVRS